MNIKVIAGFFLLFSLNANAIVPITSSSEIKQGFSGNIGFNVDYDENDGKKVELEIETSLQANYRYKDELFYTIYKFETKENNNEKTKDNMFIHARYISIDFFKNFNLETFYQYERDDFEDLSSRILFGSGLGQDSNKIIFDSGFFQMNYFAGFMFENEKSINNQELNSNNVRGTLSTRIKFSTKEEGSSIYLTTYYQPKFDDFNDFRLITTLGLESNIVGSLNIGISYEIKYNSEPFPDTPKNQESFKTYLNYSF